MFSMEINITKYDVYTFPFEDNFDQGSAHVWMINYWQLSFAYSAIYVMFICGGQHYMKNRPRFELRVPLATWSSFLAMFSIAGMVRTVPELVYRVREYGFGHSVCDSSAYFGQTGFWGYMFTISKLYELADTAFIILRKQPLIFLHWYHHITVMIYCWYSYTDLTAQARWFMVMNYVVHAFMYTYYAMRAMKIRPPRFINIGLTTMQIAQMVMGLGVIVKSYSVKSSGKPCNVSFENMFYGMIMYISYFILFAWFFYSTYIRAKPKPVQHKDQVNGSVANDGKFSNGIANGLHSNGILANGITTNGMHSKATNGNVTNGNANGHRTRSRDGSMKKND